MCLERFDGQLSLSIDVLNNVIIGHDRKEKYKNGHQNIKLIQTF